MYLIECFVLFMGYKVLVIKLRGNYLFIEWDFNVECFGEKICEFCSVSSMWVF